MTRQAYIHHPSKTIVFWTYKGANTSIVLTLAFDVFGFPKGCSDPRGALAPYLVHHSKAMELIERKGYRSIALIREPYERLISAFLHIFVARENVGITTYDQLEIVGRTGYATIVGNHQSVFSGIVFRHFVEHCLREIENRNGEPDLDGHWNTQIPFEFLDRRFEYDFLYRLDQSSEFFRKLGELTGKLVSERRVNEHKRSETHTPCNLVDTPSVGYCNDGTLRHPANFEDQALRARVEKAYVPDRFFFSRAQEQSSSVKPTPVDFGKLRRSISRLLLSVRR